VIIDAVQLSKAVGKPVKVVHLPLEGLIKGMTSHGVPDYMAQVFGSFDSSISKGQLSGNSSDFEKLTGTKPRPFADWLQENKQAFLG
jgi:NAD(P)H dehydrogenase (quinone)